MRPATGSDAFGSADSKPKAGSPKNRPDEGNPNEEKEDYTARLLEAKRKAKKNNN
jgi:hypothetical protein